MFGKLKDKLKGAFKKFGKSIEDEAEEIVEPVVESPEVEEVVEEKSAPEEEQASDEVVPEKPTVEEPVEVEDKPEVDEAVEEPVPEEEIVPSVEEVSDSEPVAPEVPKAEEEPVEEPEPVEPVVESPEVEELIEEEPVPVVDSEIVEEPVAVEEEYPAIEEVSDSEFDDVADEKPKKGLFKRLFSKKDSDEIAELEKKEAEILEEEVKDIKEEVQLDAEFSELDELEKAQVVDEKELLEEDIQEEILDSEEKVEEIEKKKPTIFSKVKDSITKKKISDSKFEELFFEVEVALLENNVSFDVVQKIKDDLKADLVNVPIARGEIMVTILDSLKKSIESLFEVEQIDLLEKTSSKKPLVISFIGVNGSGKTTQLAKVAKMFKDAGKTCVIAACDTFRAAAIQQLETHAVNLDIKMIKHDYGADAAAVAYDAIEHAKSKDMDVVLLDTAGRLHSNVNLMNELEKLMRISNPDFNIFVGESITGNDCVEQATLFGEAVRIDGIILTKADVDDKGGAALSISYVTKKPILYLGMGQDYDDLKPFSKKLVLNNLGL